MLETFAKTKKICGRCGNESQALWKADFKSGATLPVCKECLQFARDHKLVKRNYGLIQ